MPEYPKDPKKHAAEFEAIAKRLSAIKADAAKLQATGNAADATAADAEQIIKTEVK